LKHPGACNNPYNPFNSPAYLKQIIIFNLTFAIAHWHDIFAQFQPE
jgi:hypothetical protein